MVETVHIDFNGAQHVCDALATGDCHLDVNEMLGLRVLARLLGLSSNALRQLLVLTRVHLPAQVCRLETVLGYWSNLRSDEGAFAL